MNASLSRLRMLGVVESRRRRGMILTEPDVLRGIIRVLHLPVLSDRTQEDLFELRVILELGLGDLVFPHRTEENLQELEELVQREEKAPQDLGIALECDITFHECLYSMTQNETLSRFRVLLTPFFKWKGEELFDAHRFEDNDAVSHRDLLEVLKHGTPDEFRETMHIHIGNNLEFIRHLRAERAARAENDGTEGEEAEISQSYDRVHLTHDG